MPPGSRPEWCGTRERSCASWPRRWCCSSSCWPSWCSGCRSPPDISSAARARGAHWTLEMRDQPSLTAYRVALSRAAHQLLDRPPVLEDPIALAIVGERGIREIRAAPWRFNARLARHLRAFLVARSRLAEAGLAAALRRGVRQYVVLGAGLDTFPYRNPYPAGQLRVFEVDHPATQTWKRRQLSAAGLAPP